MQHTDDGESLKSRIRRYIIRRKSGLSSELLWPLQEREIPPSPGIEHPLVFQLLAYMLQWLSYPGILLLYLCKYRHIIRGGILRTGGVPDIQSGIRFLHDEGVAVGAHTLGLVQSVCSVCAYGLIHHQVSYAQFCIIAVKSEVKVIFAALSACLTLNRLLSCRNSWQYID